VEGSEGNRMQRWQKNGVKQHHGYHGSVAKLIVNHYPRKWGKRKGNKRNAVNNKAHLYPQNSTFGLRTIELAIRVNESG
jgi:hypothetical protein